MGSLLLCVILLVQANRNDTSDRCLGPAAESMPSGIGLDWIGLHWIGLELDWSRHREVGTVFGITPLVCGFACAGQ